MLKQMKRAAIVTALAAMTITVAAPAQARDRYYGDRDNDAALAIGAGVVGLAIGAAIASDRRDRRYYDDRYYYDGYYRSYPRYRSYSRDRYPRYYRNNRSYRADMYYRNDRHYRDGRRTGRGRW